MALELWQRLTAMAEAVDEAKAAFRAKPIEGKESLEEAMDSASDLAEAARQLGEILSEHHMANYDE